MTRLGKQKVTQLMLLDGVLDYTIYENRVVYQDSKGNFIRDSLRGIKRYLNSNNEYEYHIRTVARAA